MSSSVNKHNPDIVLIGAGIMSATLGVLLKELNPSFNIVVLELLDSVALESSDAWNNAGTGHSAFCELNYTPEKEDGSIGISKAIQIADQFEISKEFWVSLLQKNYINNPAEFPQVPQIAQLMGISDIGSQAYISLLYDDLAAKINERLGTAQAS